MPETVWIIVRIAIILIVGYFLTCFALRGMHTAGTKANIPVMLLQPLRNMLKLIAVAVILTLVAGQFGIELMTILTATVAMVAIGFIAVWSMVSNVTATLLLVTVRPFNIGDSVQFAGEEVKGKVVDVNLFYTTIDTDGEECYQIPNNMFFQKVLKRRRSTSQKAVPLGEHMKEAES
jgi:small-conductance mechanosensitive channel